MQSRQGIVEIFSTYIFFEDDRFSKWLVEPGLRRSMNTLLRQNHELEDSENTCAIYWYQQWKEQGNRLALGHLAAYLQETCYWSANKATRVLTNSSYGLSDCFQLASAEIDKILTGYNPNRGISLKGYASFAYPALIRDILRQHQEIDIVTDWTLLRRLSKKRMMVSLHHAGLTADEINRYELAWQCYKTLYDTAESLRMRKMRKPEPAQWAEIATLYNTQRQQLTAPGEPLTPETVEQLLTTCAKWARQYLYPTVISLNTSRPGRGSGELLDELPSLMGRISLHNFFGDTETVLQDAKESINHQIWQIFILAIANFSDRNTQKVLKLYYGKGLTQSKIAKQLNLKQYAVSRRLVRIRDFLLRELIEFLNNYFPNYKNTPEAIGKGSEAIEEMLHSLLDFAEYESVELWPAGILIELTIDSIRDRNLLLSLNLISLVPNEQKKYELLVEVSKVITRSDLDNYIKIIEEFLSITKELEDGNKTAQLITLFSEDLKRENGTKFALDTVLLISNPQDRLELIKAIIEPLQKDRLTRELLFPLTQDSDKRVRAVAYEKLKFAHGRDALVVGINNYSYQLAPNQKQAANDAEELAQALEKSGNFFVRRFPENIQESRVRISQSGEVSKQKLEQALSALFCLNSSDVSETVLFYFCGLGGGNSDSQDNCLFTSDVRPDRNEYGISLKWLWNLIKKSPVKKCIIWLDAIYSNTLVKIIESDQEFLSQSKDLCVVACEITYDNSENNLTHCILSSLKSFEANSTNDFSNLELIHSLNAQNKHGTSRIHPICFNSGEPIVLIPKIESFDSSDKTEAPLTYSVSLNLFSREVLIGEKLEVSLVVQPSGVDVGAGSSCQITLNQQPNSNELNFLLSPPVGFGLDSNNAASLLIEPPIANQPSRQKTYFLLTPLRPGLSDLTVDIYQGEVFKTSLTTSVEVTSLTPVSAYYKQITAQPRPVPQPDIVLQIRTVWDEAHSVFRFNYQFKNFRVSSFLGNEIRYQSQALSEYWIKQLRRFLTTSIEKDSRDYSEDSCFHLVSFGQYLFQQILPFELQRKFRKLLSSPYALSVLILTDQDTWIPWELLHDGHCFLSEKLVIGQWFQELDEKRPYEFQVGSIHLSYYATGEGTEHWAKLLEPPGAPPPTLLSGGVLNDRSETETLQSLHLLRCGQSADAANRYDAPVALDDIDSEQDLDQQLSPIKLNLRRNRPLVSLGYIRSDIPELTNLEQTWVPAFIRAGASAFVGSQWAVDPAVEAAFISSFYNRLWLGDSLGEAFQTAREFVRTVNPDSIDWLAYCLFGDPMARPYRPVKGKGYAVVEPIGRDIQAPFPTNIPARFRLSLRRLPPVWHEERVIEVAEDLTFEDLQVHVVTFGLEVNPAPITMSRTPNGNYLGWFTLTAPPTLAGETSLVQVYFADGVEPIHSVTFSLQIATSGGEA